MPTTEGAVSSMICARLNVLAKLPAEAVVSPALSLGFASLSAALTCVCCALSAEICEATYDLV